MEKQIIKKSIEINAPKEKVWDVLLNDQFIRIWYSAFGDGVKAETDWNLGSKAVFTDNSKSGMVGKIIAKKPGEILSVEYQGVVVDGVEDYDSDDAMNVKGGLETYELTEKDGVTKLAISCDMSEEYFEMMSEAWENALQKIKELAETT